MILEKKCSKCGETKSIDDFYKQKGGLYERSGQCKNCLNTASAARYKKHEADCKEAVAKVNELETKLAQAEARIAELITQLEAAQRPRRNFFGTWFGGQ